MLYVLSELIWRLRVNQLISFAFEISAYKVESNISRLSKVECVGGLDFVIRLLIRNFHLINYHSN